MIGHRPSQSLYQYGQVQRVVMLLNLITGASIWAVAGLIEGDFATADAYGDLIVAVDAEIWAMPLALGAAGHLVGQVVNGDPRLRPWVTPLWRFVGSLMCAVVMIGFTIGGLFAPMALFTTVHFIQSFVFSLVCLWFMWLAGVDLLAGIRKQRTAGK